jgi:hypothetical protein
MSKIGIESLGEHLLSDVAEVLKEANRAVHAALVAATLSAIVIAHGLSLSKNCPESRWPR